MQETYNVGIYCRLSREDADHLESNSIQSQRAICLAYIEGHDDLELVDTYIDDGETGSNTDRPGFQRMIQDMRSGRINCAVSKDLSRFSRNYIDAGNYLEVLFVEKGVRFIVILSISVDTFNSKICGTYAAASRAAKNL